MMFKAVLVLCVALSMGYRLHSKVDELQTTMAAFDQAVNYLAHEASISLRAYLVPISLYSTDANSAYISNLTDAGQLYWDFVADAQADAAQKGVDIESCVDSGNAQVYTLNDTFATAAFRNIKAVAAEAEETLNGFYGPARDEPLQHVADLWVKVNACDSDACAVDLIQQISDDFEQLDAGIAKALSDAKQYVLVEYPAKLNQYSFDVDAYTAALKPIIDSVKQCINSLGH
ncbi:uncharacterized protein LOC143204513 [Rhynchophorus ferrugineus]|uniref:uncharacterized protein LOC143204513 n=1 Tax=Rhynchophorus ferrugineus TaxID=354439 RepID=UPI003FCEAFA1